MQRLTRRADFQAASGALRVPVAAFVLQARQRSVEGPARVGFTVSRKVGNAVERNRVRRRLREAVRLATEHVMRGGYDYVLVGRRAALVTSFGQMRQDLDAALRRVHESDGHARRGRRATGGLPPALLHEAGSPPPGPDRTPREA